MEDFQLTAHFKLSEFTKSEKAKKLQIVNFPTANERQNLLALCHCCLEPIREFIKKPITITSGYRCPELNVAVKGARNSQHRTGEACDFVVGSEDDLKKVYAWAKQHLLFDQMLFERNTRESKSHWIHISYVRFPKSNRGYSCDDYIKFK